MHTRIGIAWIFKHRRQSTMGEPCSVHCRQTASRAQVANHRLTLLSKLSIYLQGKVCQSETRYSALEVRSGTIPSCRVWEARSVRQKVFRRSASHIYMEEVMELTVFVEQLDEATYRAETAQPIALAAEGRTRDEAIERLCLLVQQRLTTGAMVRLDIPEVEVPHPWVPFAGIWKDHPDLDAVLEHMAAERRRLDAAESGA